MIKLLRFWGLLICLGLLFQPAQLKSQSQEIKNAMFTISKMTNGGAGDQTTQMLLSEGFIVPDNLTANWNNFSSFRKIETAYWAAEKSEAGSGDHLIGNLSQKLASQFESVFVEAPLNRFLAMEPKRIKFAPLKTFALPANDLKPELYQPILSISKYTNTGALGGTYGILKYQYDLDDELAVKILRESATAYDAMLIGLEHASIPPEKKVRIQKIIKELRENYLTAKLDLELQKILGEPDFVMEKSGHALAKKPSTQKIEVEYDAFLRKHYAIPGTLDFNQMKNFHEGFGGVIFGNKIKSGKNIGKPTQIVWIHEKDAKGVNNAGRLEFIYPDGNTRCFPGVLWEDIYAAYNIVYSEDNKFKNYEGEGIGLIGADYPENYEKDKVFDSLIRSYHLTPMELAYYKFRSKLKVITNIAKRDMDILMQINAYLYYAGSSLQLVKDSLDITKEGTELHNKLFKKQQIIKDNIAKADTKHTEFVNRWKEDSLTYIKAREIEQKFIKRDSMAIVHVDQYLSLCNKVIIHPVIANLELGSALYRCDIMPRISSALIQKLKLKGATEKEIAACKLWLTGTDSIGWKFTDDSLFIDTDKNLITVQRANNNKKSGYLIFNAIDSYNNGKNASEDRPVFVDALPVMTRTFYDYHRLDNFAKVMAIVRWAKQNEMVFLNKPKTPPMYAAPAYSKLNEKGDIFIVNNN